MRETLIRLASGIIYVVVLIVASSYSLNSFLILFGIFLLIAVYEFCSLLNFFQSPDSTIESSDNWFT